MEFIEEMAQKMLTSPNATIFPGPMVLWAWNEHAVEKAKAVLDRIQSHGVIERVVTDVEDDSVGATGSVRGGWKFGAAGKRIRMHKQLVEATARTGGADRDRFDCATA